VSQRLLLDTHALLWALSNPRRLPARLTKVLRDPESDVYVSSVATWEIAIKSDLGRIDVDAAAVARAAREADFDELPVTISHTLRLLDLPDHHRDPFDRLLIAQALEERMTIVTHDPLIRRYPVSLLWD
jgi:PIN domain nuclease of toxin-antitoxin system